MDEPNLTIFKRYAIHTFLQSFTQSLLVTFGVLFIYAKTGSILIALLAELGNISGDLIIRSSLIDWLWNKVFQRRTIFAMIIGTIITSLASFGIFFVDTSKASAALFLIVLSAINSMGTSIYWIPSNAIFFQITGNSRTPGRYVSLITILQIFAAMFAAGISLVLNVQNNFLLLLPFLATMALLSLVPLMGLHLPIEEPISWARSVKRMSLRYFLANFVGDNQFKNTALPLILVLLYGSFSTSVSISALTLICAAVFGYLAGRLKDNNKNWLFVLALLGLIVVWILYAVIKIPIGFVVLGTLGYIFSTIIGIGRDARLGRDAANNKHFTESALAVELTRALGNLTGWILIVAIYLSTNTLPQFMLVFGILFVIPRGLYAIGALKSLKIIKP